MPFQIAELLIGVASDEKCSGYKRKYKMIVALLLNYSPSDCISTNHSPTLNSLTETDAAKDDEESESRTLIHEAVRIEDNDTLRYILKNSLINANARDHYNRTPLHLHASDYTTKCTEILLSQKDINVNAQDYLGYTPLHYAVEHDTTRYAELLLAHPNINVNIQNIFHLTPLQYAANSGHSNGAKLLSARKDINLAQPHQSACTQLNLADRCELVETLNNIIEQNNNDVNARDEYDRTLLHYAVQNGSIDCVKLLLAVKAINVSIMDHKGKTPLHCAVERSDVESLKLLLAFKYINVNLKDILGKTPLHYAVDRSDIDCIKLLLSNPYVDVNIEDDYGHTPLSLTHKENYSNKEQIVSLLVEHGAV